MLLSELKKLGKFQFPIGVGHFFKADEDPAENQIENQVLDDFAVRAAIIREHAVYHLIKDKIPKEDDLHQFVATDEAELLDALTENEKDIFLRSLSQNVLKTILVATYQAVSEKLGDCNLLQDHFIEEKRKAKEEQEKEAKLRDEVLLTFGEPNDSDAAILASSKKDDTGTIAKKAADCMWKYLLDHNIEREPGKPASKKEVEELMRSKSGLSFYVLEKWQAELPLMKETSRR